MEVLEEDRDTQKRGERGGRGVCGLLAAPKYPGTHSTLPKLLINAAQCLFTYTTLPRHAITEPHPLNCPPPGECLPVCLSKGKVLGQNPASPAATAINGATRLGAGAVAAGSCPQAPRLSTSSEWCASSPADLGSR